MDLTIRKVTTITEEVYLEGAGTLATPLRVATAIAVVKNPYAGQVQKDLSLFSQTYSPELGDFQRAATKGIAVVPAAEKRGGVGATIDLSLRSALDGGSLAATDTTQLFSWEVRVADAPHADEILVIVVLGDGGRPDIRKEA